jgi:hypothetical protein
VQADPFDGRDMTLARNGHMNRVIRLVGESLELGRALVTKDSARTRRKHRGPEAGTTTGGSGESGIDTGMDSPPSIAPDPEFDHVHGESGLEGLGARYHAGLVSGQIAESRRKLTFHGAQCGGSH